MGEPVKDLGCGVWRCLWMAGHHWRTKVREGRSRRGLTIHMDVTDDAQDNQEALTELGIDRAAILDFKVTRHPDRDDVYLWLLEAP
jgi:hypothetical protein